MALNNLSSVITNFTVNIGGKLNFTSGNVSRRTLVEYELPLNGDFEITSNLMNVNPVLRTPAKSKRKLKLGTSSKNGKFKYCIVSSKKLDFSGAGVNLRIDFGS